jgi:predicted GNAT family acetyltransferase
MEVNIEKSRYGINIIFHEERKKYAEFEFVKHNKMMDLTCHFKVKKTTRSKLEETAQMLKKVYDENFRGIPMSINIGQFIEKDFLNCLKPLFGNIIKEVSWDGYCIFQKRFNENGIIKEVQKSKLGRHVFYSIRFLNKKKKVLAFADISYTTDTTFISVDETRVERELRGKGLGKELYRFIAKVYHMQDDLRDKPIRRNFASPISEYLAKWCIEEKIMPGHSWEPELTTFTRIRGIDEM